MKFRTILLQARKTATGVVVPPEIVEALGAGRKPKVKVTINGYTWRSSVAVMDGKFMVGVNAEAREGAGVAGGDEVDVHLELDAEPREVEVPADLAGALAREPAAAARFSALSYSNQRRHVMAIDAARTDETRARRIDACLAALRS